MPLTKTKRSAIMMDLIGTSSSSKYLALSTTAPNADGGNVTEPSGGGYRRISMYTNIISGNGKNFPDNPTWNSETQKYSIKNRIDMMFYEATAAWGTINYFAIYDAQTGGSVVAYGQLTTPISPVANTIPIIRAEQLVIQEE